MGCGRVGEYGDRPFVSFPGEGQHVSSALALSLPEELGKHENAVSSLAVS